MYDGHEVATPIGYRDIAMQSYTNSNDLSL